VCHTSTDRQSWLAKHELVLRQFLPLFRACRPSPLFSYRVVSGRAELAESEFIIVFVLAALIQKRRGLILCFSVLFSEDCTPTFSRVFLLFPNSGCLSRVPEFGEQRVCRVYDACTRLYAGRVRVELMSECAVIPTGERSMSVKTRRGIWQIRRVGFMDSFSSLVSLADHV